MADTLSKQLPLHHPLESLIRRSSRLLDEHNQVALPLPPGAGSPFITLGLPYFNARSAPYTALIASPLALVSQLAANASVLLPDCRIFICTTVGGNRFVKKNYSSDLSQKTIDGDATFTFEELASIGPDKWKERYPQPNIFIAGFHRIPVIAGALGKWFDYVVEGESHPLPGDTVRRELIRSTGKKFIQMLRYHEANLPHGL
jgi:hypothetical protein